MGSSGVLGHELAPVVITGQYDNAIGTSDAASQGIVGTDLLQSRPLFRPAEILETIPGMVITQHSGDGKANQYFLRGMNLDHGTDFSTTLNGVPINMPTHAHGQGYSDLNVLIPELVSRVQYRKGPYFASEGDFSSAGSANIVYRTRLDRPMTTVTLGQRGYLRGVAADSREVSNGITLLTAVELLNNNGPWVVPQGMRKRNAQFMLSGGSPREGWTSSLSTYSARWNSTDQVPQRLLDAGSYLGLPFGRFDSLDSTDGASTDRTSLSGSWHHIAEHEVTRLNWYALQYNFNLYSNFTYSLDRSQDQFSQTDNRVVLGGKLSRSWLSELDNGSTVQNTLGLQVRQDRIRLGLFDTASRQILATVRDDDVSQTLAGIYAENEVGWNPWVRTVTGVRADQFNAHVTSHVLTTNSGTSSASKISPKVSLILGPWNKTEFFFNAGKGFHSNDARGTTARVDPKNINTPVDSVPGLVSSRGQEIGMKSLFIPSWHTTVAVWRLDFDSELVYVGDAGTTRAGRPAQRTGVEWSNQWKPRKELLMDANLAWTRPRYSDQASTGNYIANAAQKVGHLGMTVKDVGRWSGSVSLRYVGTAPLNEDNSVQSPSSLTANLRLHRAISPDVEVTLDVLNATDRKNKDISNYYTSRLATEPASGVADTHVHPAEPRTLRVTARVQF